jgi:glutamate N-acetyltransferase/amino-acid N-acetyltransferase
VRTGVRRRLPDLALIVAEGGCDAAAVFTRNRFQAAPVVVSKRSLARSGGRLRAAVVNAGCANAITGREGTEAALRVQRRAAELLGCSRDEVFLASTGVIGVVLPDAKVRAGLPAALSRLSPTGLDAASRAILTTDAGPKTSQATFACGGRRARILGFAKGAGMIHPNMATMLGFVMTDAAVSPALLRASLRAAVDESFNAISVDGDTSTNDTVLLMASGKLGAAVEGAADVAAFQDALTRVCRELARMIVRDGEGATRLMVLDVRGARSTREARLAAHALATSPLVKTALHGGDPNWGRILAAVGRSGAHVSPGRVSLRIGPMTLVRAGQPTDYREKDAARVFSRDEVPITVDLGLGDGKASFLSCDLGHEYVSLNADYRS